MSIKSIGKRIQHFAAGIVMSGSMVFTPMSGCDLVADANPATKGLLDAGRIAVTSEWESYDLTTGTQNTSSAAEVPVWIKTTAQWWPTGHTN